MTVQVVGHRGWPARFPDNTLAGLLAVSAAADAVEIDIRRSGDGKLVLAHDPLVGDLIVSETPWAVLSGVDLGGGHRPALLDEVLAALPDTPVHLEVKNLPHQAGFEPDHRLALETAERSRPADTVTSFNPTTLAVVRRSFPEVRTGLAVGRGGDLEEVARLCHQVGHPVLAPAEEMITRPVHELGLEIYPWTVDDPARAGELVELGVSGIITNDAPRLIAAFRGET
jgi:glycerophosphoryl diester phosphodiesterase